MDDITKAEEGAIDEIAAMCENGGDGAEAILEGLVRYLLSKGTKAPNAQRALARVQSAHAVLTNPTPGPR